MANMRSISRLILRSSSQCSLPRWLSTAAAQPKSRNTIFYKVAEASSDLSVVSAINEWVAEGKIVRITDIIRISTHLRSRKNFRAALQLYEWMDSSNLEMDDTIRAMRIDIIAKAEGVASAEKYFDSLQEKTDKTYGALLSCYCKNRVLDKALETFEKMNELNYAKKLDYNNMLSLYHHLEKPEKVFSLRQEMEEKNIAPDIFTYNILINTHAYLKNFDAIEEVIKKMESTDVKPDFFTYGNLATIFFNAGLREKANSFLQRMEELGIPKKSSREACHTRLRLYSLMNDPSGVNRAWEGLKSVEPKPSNTSYLCMLLALSKLENQENLEKILKEWEEGCTLYDYRLPNVLLEYYLSRDMIEEANLLYERLLDRVTDRGTGIHLKTLHLFTSLSLKNSQIDLALEYLEKGLEIGKLMDTKWFPTSETIEAFINYFEEKNDRERGGKFVEIMKKHDRLQSDSLLSYIKATDEEANIC